MSKRSLLASVPLASIALAVVVSCGSSGAKVYMALDNDGARHRSTFYTDTETIVCIAEVSAPRDGVTVSALIRQTRTDKDVDNILAIGEQVPQKQAPGQATPKLAFVLTKSGGSQDDSSPWPVGSFECEVSVDGILKGIAPFDIQMPTCPLYPAATGVLCKGFYPPKTRCPAQDQTVFCTCTEAGTWQCDQ
jgi:hypothetical protein